MSIKKIFLCLIYSFGLIYHVKSQNNSVYTYRNYTTLNGLASNEVYNVMCDSKGEMWFSTAGGASKFDGQTFTNYTRAQGLPDNTIFKLTEDKKGRVWAVSFSSGLAYIQNNKIFPFKYNSVLEKSYTQSSETAIGFLSPSCDSILVAPHRATITNISFNGNSKVLPELPLNEMKQFTNVIHCFYDSRGVLVSYADKIKNNGHSTEIHYLNKSKQNSVLFVSDTIQTTVHDRIVHINSDTWLYSNDKSAFLIKKGIIERVYRFDDQILRIFQEGNSIMIGLRNKGLIRYNHYLDKDYSFIIKDLSVTGICTDKENGYWITTLENGVYYIPTFNFTNLFSNQENKLGHYTSIVYDSSFIYCGTKTGQVEKWSKQKNHLLTISPTKENSQIWKMYCDPETKDIWLSASSWGGFIKKDGFHILKGVASSLSYLRKEDWIYTGHWNYMLRFKNYDLDTSPINHLDQKKRFESLLDISKNEVIVGSMDGLYHLNTLTKNIKRFQLKDSVNKQPRVVCMLKSNASEFYLGTKGNGLLKINTKGEILERFDHSNGLLSDNIIKIKSFKNFLFLLSENGIGILKKNGSTDEIVGTLDYSSGLYNSAFSDLEIVDNYLWATGSKGIDVINLGILNQLTEPLFMISAISVSGEDTTGTSFTLPYNKNAITLKYQLVTYRNQERKIFRYRIVNRDSLWLLTKNTELNFIDLSPGTYKIEIAGSNGTKWSKSRVLVFKIEPPFWLTWWFITIEILFIVLITSFFLNNYFENRRRKAEVRMLQKQNIMELEMKALRAQINPHFIFNVLYSIQHYILFNQKEEAQKYLSKFAKLLRSILQNSEKNVVSLGEEIAVLELYLELEEMRFENKFSHQITVAPSLDINLIKVPTLLVQPIIENAIKHGVGHLKSGGFIKIEFKTESEKLICEVDDNGVGRAFHKNQDKPYDDYKSMGMEITRDRVETLGEQFSAQTKLTIFDKTLETNGETGTKVIIELPLLK